MASQPATSSTSSVAAADADKAKQQWAYKVLEVSENGVSGGRELEQLRLKSKEMYKTKAREKKTSEAKQVLEAFEVIKKAFQAKEERRKQAKKAAASSQKSSSSRKESQTSGQEKKPGTSGQEKRPQSSGSEKKAHTSSEKKPSTSGQQSSRSSSAGASASKPSSGTSSVLKSQKPSGSFDASAGPGQKRARFGVTTASEAKEKVTTPLKQNHSTSLHRSSTVLICAGCGEAQNPKRTPDLKKTGVFLCPGCRFRAMDPLSPLREAERGLLKLMLLQPPLVPESSRGEATIKMKLNMPNLQKWRKAGEEIEARMINLDTCEPNQAWPHTLSLWTNGSKAFEIEPPKEGHKRRDVPRRISASLKSGVNELEIRMKDGFTIQRFAMALVRVKPLTVRQLCQEVKLVSEEASRQLVIELLFSSMLESTGEEVHAAGSDRSRLICPVTLQRIETPVRGHKCRHLQCFDLKAYLVSNLRMSAFNKRWLCPVCAIRLKPPSDLFIDMHMMQILSGTEGDDEEVGFDQKGDWTVTAKAEPPGSPSSDELGLEEDEKEPEEPADPAEDAPDGGCASPAGASPEDDEILAFAGSPSGEAEAVLSQLEASPQGSAGSLDADAEKTNEVSATAEEEVEEDLAKPAENGVESTPSGTAAESEVASKEAASSEQAPAEGNNAAPEATADAKGADAAAEATKMPAAQAPEEAAAAKVEDAKAGTAAEAKEESKEAATAEATAEPKAADEKAEAKAEAKAKPKAKPRGGGIAALARAAGGVVANKKPPPAVAITAVPVPAADAVSAALAAARATMAAAQLQAAAATPAEEAPPGSAAVAAARAAADKRAGASGKAVQLLKRKDKREPVSKAVPQWKLELQNKEDDEPDENVQAATDDPYFWHSDDEGYGDGEEWADTVARSAKTRQGQVEESYSESSPSRPHRARGRRGDRHMRRTGRRRRRDESESEDSCSSSPSRRKKRRRG